MAESFEMSNRHPQDRRASRGKNVREDLQHADNTMNETHRSRSRSPSAVPPFTLPPRPLSRVDVASLIFNKMVGTGIFTAPPSVLLLTGSPGLALGLWILGFAYTVTSMFLYLEYARKLPHTGGELIYLDETLPGPNFLAFTIYSFYFLLLYNTATNCMRFANYVLQCATGPDTVQDERLLRFLAIVILSFICALHFRSARMARFLNVALTALKIVLLLIIFIAGAVKASQQKADWSNHPSDNPSSTAAAFLLVLFSYQGWENATFVAGEIRNYDILKWGFITAVMTVGTLYVLVNIVFLSVVAYSDGVTDYVPLFFGNSLAAQKASDVIIAISAAGSLLSVIYSSARVKQAIGISNVFPWSRVWSTESRYQTPEGGLLLQWIFSVTLIAVTAAIQNVSDAISFPGTLQAYGTGVIGILIGIGFPHLGREDIPGPSHGPGQRAWTNSIGFYNTTARRWYLSAVYIVFNSYVFIVTFIPPYQNPDGSTREIKGWFYPAIVGGTIFIGFIYYWAAFGGVEKSVFRIAKAKAEVNVQPTHHAKYGCRKYIVVTLDDPRSPSILYRSFGGHLTGDED